MIFTNKPYENNDFFMTEIQYAPLTIESVAYSVFMKMEENQNVLPTLTRSIFLHIPNHTAFTFHAVATVGITISENVSETTARALLWDLINFDECNLGGRCRRTRKSTHPSLTLLLFFRFLLRRF